MFITLYLLSEASVNIVIYICFVCIYNTVLHVASVYTLHSVYLLLVVHALLYSVSVFSLLCN